MNQTNTCATNRTLLRRFIEEHAETLLGTLRYYVVRAGLADSRGATLAAVELLNKVTVEALAALVWHLSTAARVLRQSGGREPEVVG